MNTGYWSNDSDEVTMLERQVMGWVVLREGLEGKGGKRMPIFHSKNSIEYAKNTSKSSLKIMVFRDEGAKSQRISWNSCMWLPWTNRSLGERDLWHFFKWGHDGLCRALKLSSMQVLLVGLRMETRPRQENGAGWGDSRVSSGGGIFSVFRILMEIGNKQRKDFFTVELHVCLVTLSCPTLCDPMDCSSPGSSVHGILQAWI